jgi:hypothetical protein
MYRTRWLAGVLATAATAAALMAASAVSQEGAGPVEHRDVQSAVKNTRPVAFWVVEQDFTGDFQGVKPALTAFTNEFNQQGLGGALPGFSPKQLLILPEDPTGRPTFPFTLGLTVPRPLAARPPLRLARVEIAKAAVLTHLGPYEQLGPLHGQMVKALPGLAEAKAPDRGPGPGFPSIVVLHNDPTLVKPEEIKSDLIIPATPPRPTLAPEVLRSIAEAAARLQPVSFDIVTEPFNGPVTDLGAMLQKFMSDFEAQNLGPLLSGPGQKPLAIIHGNPDLQRVVPIEIAFPVKRPVAVHPPLANRRLEFDKAARVVHRGQFADLSQVHAEIVKALPKGADGAPNAGFPVILELLTDPLLAAPDQVRTGMIVPAVAAPR